MIKHGYFNNGECSSIIFDILQDGRDVIVFVNPEYDYETLALKSFVVEYYLCTGIVEIVNGFECVIYDFVTSIVVDSSNANPSFKQSFYKPMFLA